MTITRQEGIAGSVTDSVAHIRNDGTDDFSWDSVSGRAFQRMLAQMGYDTLDEGVTREREKKEEEEHIQELASRAWLMTFFQNYGSIFSDDNTSPLSFTNLVSKGVLTTEDVEMADTNDSRVATMRVLHIRGGYQGRDMFLVGDKRDEYMGQCSMDSNCTDTTMSELQSAMIERQLRLSAAGETRLTPSLERAMLRNPALAHQVGVAIQAGNEAGIDGTMYANQLWQESNFKPNAVSGKGAVGVAQMMPFQVGKYGLDSYADLYNPEKSIKAGARMMAELTSQYGDQRMALVAYNSGERSIRFVEKRLGVEQVSFDDWYKFMVARNERLGSGAHRKSAWDVETRDYVERIALKNAVAADAQTITRRAIDNARVDSLSSTPLRPTGPSAPAPEIA